LAKPLLHYTISGSGPPLIILHGLFGSGKNWQSQVRRYRNQFNVVSVDLRNHGLSFHDHEMNYAAMVDDVMQLLDALELPRCCLLGHSMGGKLGMMIAWQYPQRIERLVVADIAPVNYQHHFDDLIEAVMAIPLDEFHTRKEVDLWLRVQIPDDMLRGFLLQSLVRVGDGWQWRIHWAAIKQNFSRLSAFDELPPDWRITVPSLFIRGARSDYITDTGLTAIAEHFQAANMVTVANAGHWLHFEQPDQFSEYVLDFLSNPQSSQESR